MRYNISLNSCTFLPETARAIQVGRIHATPFLIKLEHLPQLARA